MENENYNDNYRYGLHREKYVKLTKYKKRLSEIDKLKLQLATKDLLLQKIKQDNEKLQMDLEKEKKQSSLLLAKNFTLKSQNNRLKKQCKAKKLYKLSCLPHSTAKQDKRKAGQKTQPNMNISNHPLLIINKESNEDVKQEKVIGNVDNFNGLINKKKSAPVDSDSLKDRMLLSKDHIPLILSKKQENDKGDDVDFLSNPRTNDY